MHISCFLMDDLSSLLKKNWGIKTGIYSASNADSWNRICRILFSEIPILVLQSQHKESRSPIKMIGAVL